ncbi:acyltransferase family protein [Prosthecobacter vanneervenii]|uniref:acyltransferase family protein n=1 Tax=Prosthecobacter vanneervenii TaxID=48466 RepID=UPI001FE45F00|nr:acyltransferase [Prosthecobacter vanneervenii]
MDSKATGPVSFHIPSLDGLRSVAILIVFLSHAGLSHVVPGLFGVTIFFFLSGYLITTLLRMECERTGGVNLRQFFLRRTLRILPPFYLVLFLIALLCASGVLPGGSHIQAFTAQALFAANYWEIHGGFQPPGTEVLWSLAVEEHFYLVFPFFYLGMRRVLPDRSHQFALLLTLCAAVLVWRMLLVHQFSAIDLHSGSAHHPRTCHGTDTRLDGLLFGCALAVWGNPALDSTRIRRSHWLFVLLPACVALLLASFLIRSVPFRETWRYTVQGLALMPVFICVIRFHDSPLLRFLNWSWVSRLGVFSYAFYLTHSLLLALMEECLPDSMHLSHLQLMMLRGMAAFALSLASSWIIHHGVERPFLRLRRRLGGAAPTVQHKQSSGLALNHA